MTEEKAPRIYKTLNPVGQGLTTHIRQFACPDCGALVVETEGVEGRKLHDDTHSDIDSDQRSVEKLLEASEKIVGVLELLTGRVEKLSEASSILMRKALGR